MDGCKHKWSSNKNAMMFELSSGDGPFHLDAIEEKMFLDSFQSIPKTAIRKRKQKMRFSTSQKRYSNLLHTARRKLTNTNAWHTVQWVARSPILIHIASGPEMYLLTVLCVLHVGSVFKLFFFFFWFRFPFSYSLLLSQNQPNCTYSFRSAYPRTHPS